MARLDIDKLVKRYGDFYAVKDVSLSVADGEFLVLLGSLRLRQDHDLAHGRGLHRADRRRGAARRQRRHPAAAVEAQRRHGVPELRAVPAPHRGAERRLRPGDAQAAQGRDRQAASRRRWRWSGSPASARRLPRQLSGGQQQRVALARALAIRPDVLLLDEPLSNLDAKLRQEVRVEIRELQSQLGLTTVMVTHDQEEALTMADRLVVMNEGAVHQVGTQRDLYERPADRFVAGFVGRTHLPRRHGRGAGPLPHRRRPRPRHRRGGEPGTAALSLRPERLEIGPAPHRGTRQRPARHGGIRLLSRRADRHPCAPVAGRPAGGADRQSRGGFAPEVGQQVHVGWRASAGQVFRE